MLGAALGYVPADADACSPCEGIEVRLVGDAAVTPANALIETNIPDDLEVTVDGQPHATETVEYAWWPRNTLIRLSPTPPAGATVVLQRDPKMCFGKDYAPEELTVGPADVEPPAPPTGLLYDLHAFNIEFDQCAYLPDFIYYVRADGGPAAGEVLRVAVLLGDEVVAGTHATLGEDPIDVPVWVDAADLGGAAPTDVCLRVSAIDAAGNETESVDLCSPCHVRVDPPDVLYDEELPPEPEWSDDDLWPDADCVGVDVPEPPDDPGGSSGGVDPEEPPPPSTTGSATTGEPEPEPEPDSDAGSGGGDGGQATLRDRGCACRSTDPGPPLVLILALLGARRRR